MLQCAGSGGGKGRGRRHAMAPRAERWAGWDPNGLVKVSETHPLSWGGNWHPGNWVTCPCYWEVGLGITFGLSWLSVPWFCSLVVWLCRFWKWAHLAHPSLPATAFCCILVNHISVLGHTAGLRIVTPPSLLQCVQYFFLRSALLHMVSCHFCLIIPIPFPGNSVWISMEGTIPSPTVSLSDSSKADLSLLRPQWSAQQWEHSPDWANGWSPWDLSWNHWKKTISFCWSC